MKKLFLCILAMGSFSSYADVCFDPMSFGVKLIPFEELSHESVCAKKIIINGRELFAREPYLYMDFSLRNLPDADARGFVKLRIHESEKRESLCSLFPGGGEYVKGSIKFERVKARYLRVDVDRRISRPSALKVDIFLKEIKCLSYVKGDLK